MSIRARADNLLRAGQFGKGRVRLALIPISYALIEIAALEWRRAVSLFNEKPDEFVEDHRVRNVPAVSRGVRFFKKSDAEVRETPRAQPIGFAEIVL